MSKRSMFLRLPRSRRNLVVNRIIYLTATIPRLSLNNSFIRITIRPQGHKCIQNKVVDSTTRSLTLSLETKFSIHLFRNIRQKRATLTKSLEAFRPSPNIPLVETSFNSTKSNSLNKLISKLKRKQFP
jgi:hypothetical protein